MIRFDNPHKMRVSQPIWELSLKKWGLYISYLQGQDRQCTIAKQHDKWTI